MKNRRASILFETVIIYMGIFMVPLLATHEKYWQQWVHYVMNVSLDVKDHLLSGESTLTYVNHSPDTLNYLYMHLYPNAFQEGSVKYREYQRVHYSGGISEENPSYIQINDITLLNGKKIDTLKFKIVDTILTFDLLSPLYPGDTLTFHINWVHKVREHSGRAGYRGEQYDFAQWYPKMVVYDEKGWHPVPFHAMGEFYGEFGTFDVTIDVPEWYIVGATGVVIDGDPGWASVEVDTSQEFSEWVSHLDSIKIDSTARRTVTFHAEQVHDFAWITSPKFVYEHGQWNGIDIHVLYNRNVGEKWTKVVRERAERAVAWLSTKFGSYPYPQVTVTHGLLGGGMEYPMLVMNGRESEGLIVHEIGHIWFYGILGNNEVDEAWLDEGFTSFQTSWYFQHRYPPYGIDFENSWQYGKFEKKWWKFNSNYERTQWWVNRYLTSQYNEPIAQTSYSFNGYSNYSLNAYSKPALMLFSLKSLLGEDLFLQAMQEYFDRWKLKHTNEKRFRSVIEEVSGQKLDWFFDQWLHEPLYTNYAIKGWDKKQNEDGSYTVTLHIVNKSNMFYPLEMDVYLVNGDTVRTRWSNFLYRWNDEYSFVVPSKPRKVVLDPDNWTHDVDLRDNVTGFLPRELVFNWPGMNYQPRDRYVVTWNPVLWYHEKDGLKPGLSLHQIYGSLSQLSISITTGVNSGKIFGETRYQTTLHRISPFLTTSVRGYFLEGVSGIGINMSYHFWHQYYNFPPVHSINAGFYSTNADSTGYTDLFEKGKTFVFYGGYRLSANIGEMGGGLNVELSTAPAGLSDWSFARLIGELTFHKPVKGFNIVVRIFGGHTESDTLGIPIQEKFTIHAAGASDYFSKPYLRHPTSLYNIKVGKEYLRNQVHLYGDANLRGYYGYGFSGAESVFTGTVEGTREFPIEFAEINFRSFLDGGMIWSVSDEFEGEWLMDLGFGVSFQKKLLGTRLKLRIDFPWFVNYTTEGQKPIDFSRFVIGFDTGL